MKVRVGVCVAFMMMMLSPAVAGEPTANELLELFDSRAETRWYLQGLENALGWGNAHLQSDRHVKPMYCPPRKMAMTVEQARAILKNFVADHPDQGKEWAGVVVLKAMQETFPCS